MAKTSPRTAFIGFGEAAMAFAKPWGPDRCAEIAAHDLKTGDPAAAAAKRGDYERHGIAGAASLGEALAGRDLVISVVTADQALAVAEAATAFIEPGALYCDFNSVAPQTKEAAARQIEAAGGRYVDVAVMAPVLPARLSVPLLVSGPHAGPACEALAALGFTPRLIDGPVGRASTIKMVRSVMVKGMEALTAECFLAAHRAGIVDEVAASLGKSWPGVDWAEKADYNLERMMVHGLRRAAEMEEVAATLAGLGIDNAMTRSTVSTQRAIGALALSAPDGLAAKSALILNQQARSS